jgi:rhamnosyltransferase
LPVASVIIRAKNKASTIESTLRALRTQTCSVEIIVVDSGSTDGTLEIASRWADKIIQIPPEAFTYGGALNIGAEAASGSVHFALSAHCVPQRDDWVEQSLRLHEDLGVAGTNQADLTPHDEPIKHHYLQTVQDALERPGWGFSNHASSWRADVWQSIRFREDLPACEDKEWSWRVLASGLTLAYSPVLIVPSLHRRKQGPRQLYRRVAREAGAMICLGAVRRPTPREAFGAWWNSFPSISRHPDALRRLSPYRLVEFAAAWDGGRWHGERCDFPPADLFINGPGSMSTMARPAHSPWG